MVSKAGRRGGKIWQKTAAQGMLGRKQRAKGGGGEGDAPIQVTPGDRFLWPSLTLQHPELCTLPMGAVTLPEPPL